MVTGTSEGPSRVQRMLNEADGLATSGLEIHLLREYVTAKIANNTREVRRLGGLILQEEYFLGYQP